MAQTGHETWQPAPDEEIFLGFGPHPEHPVQPESFWKLDAAIAAAYSLAGVTGDLDFGYLRYESHTYVYSPEQEDGAPALSLLRNMGPMIKGAKEPQNLIVLDIGTRKGELDLDVMLRNDAGTHRRPDQVAADATVRGKFGMIHDEARLTDTDIAALAEEIQKRVDRQQEAMRQSDDLLARRKTDFIKKHSRIYLL